ncbi:Glutamate receptor ionotropic, kainate 3 [Halotydeus destructor]|nr:Glutamate receptor ionotropic, kainate 3 [Halotydeus destructor]
MKLIASVVVIGLIAAAAEASLSGKELTFVTTLKRPFAEVVPGADDSTGNDRYQGFLVDLVQALAAENDFQFNLKEAQGTGSSFDDTASAVDHVVKGSADVVIGDIAPTHVRGRDVDFTAAFMNAGLSFLYKKRAISGEDQSHAHQDYETIDQLLASDVTLGVVFGSSAWSYVLKSEDSREQDGLGPDPVCRHPRVGPREGQDRELCPPHRYTHVGILDGT